eukprot:s690_g22.t1
MAGPALVEFTDALGASAPLFVQCAWGANKFGSAESETTEAEKEICRLVIFDGSHCWRGPLCRRHLAGPLGESWRDPANLRLLRSALTYPQASGTSTSSVLGPRAEASWKLVEASAEPELELTVRFVYKEGPVAAVQAARFHTVPLLAALGGLCRGVRDLQAEAREQQRLAKSRQYALQEKQETLKRQLEALPKEAEAQEKHLLEGLCSVLNAQKRRCLGLFDVLADGGAGREPAHGPTMSLEHCLDREVDVPPPSLTRLPQPTASAPSMPSAAPSLDLESPMASLAFGDSLRGARETTFSIPLTLGMSAIGFPVRGGKEHLTSSAAPPPESRDPSKRSRNHLIKHPRSTSAHDHPVVPDEDMDSPLASAKAEGREGPGSLPKSDAGSKRGGRGAEENSPRPKPRGGGEGETPTEQKESPLQQEKVFDRLYARHEDRKIRLAEARQKEKEEQQFDFRPRLELSQTGPAAEASKRLHEGVAKKRQAREELQQKYEEEFRLLHPFRPELHAAEKPWQNREEWLQDQEQWKRKRNERRAGKLQEKLDEEAQYLSSNNLHRGAQADPEAVGKRLFLAAKKREVQLQKLRAKHRAEEDEAVVNSLHRKLDNTAEAAEKVGRVVDRLYGQDRQEREQRQEQRRMKKRLAERAETSLLEAMSVHSPVDLPCDGLFQDIRDKTSLKLEQELRDLRAALMDLRSRALNADPAALRRFAANQASGKADKPPQAKAPGAGYGTRSQSPARRDPAPRPSPRAASARSQPSSAPTLPLTPRARAPPATARRDVSPARASRSPSRQAKPQQVQVAPGSSARPRTASKSGLGRRPAARLEAAPSRPSRPKTEAPRREVEKKRQAEPEALAEDAEASDESPGGGPSHEQELAATKIQSQETPTGVSPGADCEHREQELAATKIQSRVRGKQARREVQLKKQKTWVPLEETPTGVSPGADREHREQELAATKIQGRVRGKQARREMQLKKQKTWVPLEETPTGISPGADREHCEQELAATKIQSRVRGKQARREVEKRREARRTAESDEEEDEEEEEEADEEEGGSASECAPESEGEA